MDLRRQLSLLRGSLPVLIAAMVAAGGLALAGSGFLPRTYEAQSTLIVGQSLQAVNPDFSQLLASQRLSATYAELATTRPVLVSVILDLGLSDGAEELERRVKSVAAQDSTLLTITVADGSPDVAAAIANSIARELIAKAPDLQGQELDIKDFVAEQLAATQADIARTQGEVEALLAIETRTAAQESQLNVVQSRLTTLRSSYTTLLDFASNNASNILTIVEPAVAPEDPVWPRPLLNMVLAAVIALLLAVLLILGAAYLDDGLKDAEVVREALDLPTLGVVPRMTMERGRSEIYRLTMLLSPQSAAAEAYRRLRTNLEFTSVDKPLKTILITSPSAGDGKTVTAANIAVAYAQADRKVLLVDADLRKPGVHEIFNVGNAQGLSSLLHPRSPSWEKVAVATEVPNLRVLPTGPVPPNPAELIGTQRMRTILAELAEANDIVILDGPPLLPVADGAILSKYADGVVLVVDARKTGRQAGGRAKDVLARAGATMLGVVINRLRAAEMELYPAYYPGR